MPVVVCFLLLPAQDFPHNTSLRPTVVISKERNILLSKARFVVVVVGGFFFFFFLLTIFCPHWLAFLSFWCIPARQHFASGHATSPQEQWHCCQLTVKLSSSAPGKITFLGSYCAEFGEVYCISQRLLNWISTIFFCTIIRALIFITILVQNSNSKDEFLSVFVCLRNSALECDIAIPQISMYTAHVRHLRTQGKSFT